VVFCLYLWLLLFLQFAIFIWILVKVVVDDPDKQSWMANQIVIDSLKNSYSRTGT
jgi:hypothetical protein